MFNLHYTQSHNGFTKERKEFSNNKKSKKTVQQEIRQGLTAAIKWKSAQLHTHKVNFKTFTKSLEPQ